MLDKLTVKNFQSHENTEVEFSHGVNAIMGKSRQGKTSLTRALRWVADNTPKGKGHVRHGETECVVGLTTSEGNEVVRKRNSSFNGYYVNGEEAKAGRTVPERVQEILQLDEVNWQGEHDGPYLLNETAPEVARKLNEVTDLDSITKSLKLISRWSKQNKASLKSDTFSLEESLEDLKDYQNLKDFDLRLSELEELDSDVSYLYEDINRLEATVETLKGLEPQLKKFRRLSALGNQVDELMELKDDVEDLNYYVSRLSTVIQEVGRAKKQHKQAVQKRDRLRKKFHDEFPDVCPLCGATKGEQHVH